MNSCTWAAFAAVTISFILALGFANRMFSAMVVEKRTVSCKTTANWFLRSATLYCLRSTLSRVIFP